MCLLWDKLLCNFPVLFSHHCTTCFLCPCSLSSPSSYQEQDDSVWLEVRVIYIGHNRKFVPRGGRYAEKTKLNTSESKPREEYLHSLKRSFRSVPIGTSLVAQWLRIHLPMQGTRVPSLVPEDPTCCGATKPVRHNYWACALEPVSHNYWARVPRARAPQQEKPPQWEARVPQQRVAPACCK